MQLKISLRIFLSVFIFLSLVAASFAALEYDLRSGLELNWYFVEENAAWDSANGLGYFHDYNADSLQDYLIYQSNDTDKDRFFCIDTSNSATPKKYPDNRTAWKEVSWSEGTFIPQSIKLVKPHDVKRTPDLILRGKDKKTDYTKFILKRLNETTTDFAQEHEWSHTVTKDYVPVLFWANQSYNEDDYPDYLLYNSRLNAENKFFIGCYDGLTGTEIWSRTIDKAADDPAVTVISPSNLTVSVIQTNPDLNQSGDFDGNGKSEILLFYTYTLSGAKVGFSSKGKVLVLKSDGTNYSSTPSWWEVYNYATMMPLAGSAIWDFNKDTYVDFQLQSYINVSTVDIPVLQVFDLKNAAALFQTDNSGFGATAEDKDYFIAMPLRGMNMSFKDLNADSWFDLVFYRGMGFSGNPIRYCVFNAYANGGDDKGKGIWLKESSENDSCFYMANDWNSDDILDFGLAKSPEALDTGQFPWNFALPYIQAEGSTVKKTFSYNMDYSGDWNESDDTFSAFTVGMFMAGDVDGDSQQDTYATLSLTVDNGDDGEIDTAMARVFVFDNTAGDAAPDITAEFALNVTGEDISIPSFVMAAYDPGKEEFVDQNKDGSLNDICIFNPRALFALSYLYKPSKEITADDIIDVLLGKKEIPSGQEEDYDTNDDGIVDIADVIWLLKNS
jgi:hypothetical protein